MNIENKTLEKLFPRYFHEYVEPRVKKDEMLVAQGCDMSRTGPATFEFSRQHLDP